MSCMGKLTLGTVQWSMPYSVANHTGQPELAEIGNMLRVAKERGITLLDMAYSYGEAETRLVHSQVHFVAYYFLPQIPNLRAFWLSLGTEEIILTKH